MRNDIEKLLLYTHLQHHNDTINKQTNAMIKTDERNDKDAGRLL